LRLLSIRPRSVAEIVFYLQKKTKEKNLIDQTVEKLQKMKFLDDTKFAEWLVQSRSRSRPRGNRLLTRELQAKGIAPETIKAHLVEKTTEQALAAAALSKKTALWKNMAYRDFQAKAGRFLAARGFSWDVIERAVKTAYNTRDVS
jgi:SOS response regulatory protein OraA/RecX